MIKVGIIDDHAIVRTGLKQFLGEQDDIVVSGEAADGRQALQLARNGDVDVLIMDISMPGQSGIDVMANIRAHNPDLPILILSGFPEQHYAVNLLRQGASSYLNKECDPEEILAAVRALSLGKRYITPTVAELLAEQLDQKDDRPAHETLSERELQVFLHLARGQTVSAVAEILSISIKTVSTYRTRVLEKLSLSTNSDLTYYALKHKLIE